MKRFKKYIATLAIAAILFAQVTTGIPVHAEDITAPSPATVTSTSEPGPTAPSAPSAPSVPEPSIVVPSEPVAPTAPVPPSYTEITNPSPKPTATPRPPKPTRTPEQPTPTPDQNTAGSLGSPTGPSGTSGSTGVQANSNVGNTVVNTGDATTGSNIATTANTNGASGAGSGSGSGSGIGIVNTDNGANSENSGSASVINNNVTDQNNNATVTNSVNQISNTGDNSASRNVGNSTVTTGNANTSATAITAVNTNLDGVKVAEFNIADTHRGDYVLDFNAHCVSGCGDGSTTVTNQKNADGSTNSGSVNTSTNNTTIQNNNANIGSDMNLIANSGNNTASFNTAGDSTIQTGNANVSANMLTLANNNLSGGNVLYGVVNIYGDLQGDIVLPEEVIASTNCCTNTNTAATNSGNGVNSQNTANVQNVTNDTTSQNNNANITNNVNYQATTGDNKASSNTGGDSSINTGSANVDAKTINVANSNIAGGNTWWLVVVNEAGKWVGKIMGSPDGATMAGSQGTEFAVDANGQITAVNTANGANSTNNSSVNSTTNNTTIQNNNANIVNNLNLAANTGGNKTSYNTGGNSSIQTGDATVLANLVNFVNNNVTGGGKLVVTVVNVFGSWMGDFIAPGQKKQVAASAQNDAQVNTSSNDARGGLADTGNTNTTPSNSENNQTGPVENYQTGSTDNNSAGNASVKSKYVAFNYSSDSNGEGVVDGAQIITHVAGLKSVESNTLAAQSQGKKITINLAFLLLLLPVIAVFIVRKRLMIK